MKKIVISLVVIILLVGGYFYSSSRSSDLTSGIVEKNYERIELVAYNFVLDFIKVAPPAVPDEIVVGRINNALSVEAKKVINKESISSDLAKFFGVQDIPDQGVSVEDLQITSDTEAYLVVGLNYSGGRVLRNIHVTMEGKEWKVDRISTPAPSAELFEQEGNLTRNNPGSEMGTWYLVYDRPGQPGQSVKLQLIPSSICAQGNENNTCSDKDLSVGLRVKILGEEKDGLVTVARLEFK